MPGTAAISVRNAASILALHSWRVAADTAMRAAIRRSRSARRQVFTSRSFTALLHQGVEHPRHARDDRRGFARDVNELLSVLMAANNRHIAARKAPFPRQQTQQGLVRLVIGGRRRYRHAEPRLSRSVRAQPL